MTDKEWQVIDPVTGGVKNQKLAQLSSLDPATLLLLAEHAGKGAAKYGANNWRRGYDWSLSFDAAQRHLLAFWGGEDVDPENGSLHVVAAAWHCLAMASYVTRELGTDTRLKQGFESEQVTPDARIWTADMQPLEVDFPIGARVRLPAGGLGTVHGYTLDSFGICANVRLDSGERGVGPDGTWTAEIDDLTLVEE